uniref:Uncharacterized protein n=1 Tax=Amphora coffeiformis TaxID=265554 RepID=A0A7S3KZT8_9STRA
MASLSKSGGCFLMIVSCWVVLWMQTLGHWSQQQQQQQQQQDCPPQLLQQNTLRKMFSVPQRGQVHSSQRSLVVRPSDLPLVLAIYFPQFHPDPINDRNWGTNFTDWTSLRAAPTVNKLGVPLPHPLDHDYYDLRQHRVRQRQGQQAREYGVDGFVVHHYWFYDPQHPGPNLHAPVERLLQDGEPAVPFLFNWCAASWTSVWTGQAVGQTKAGTLNNPGVLQSQYWNASDVMIQEHYQWLRRFWIHKRYIRVGGHPVLMMYQWFPESVPILKRFRELATADPAVGGLTIWMSRSGTHPDLYDISKLDDKFKGVWKRKSQQLELLHPQSSVEGPIWNSTVAYPYPNPWVTQALEIPGWCRNLDESSASPPIWASLEIPGVVTSFDNTPRRQADKAVLWNVDKDPQKVVKRFRDSIHAAVYYETCCRQLSVYVPPQKFVVVNAWNEWAEGMALEPSTTYRTGFLEAIRDVKARILKEGCR